MMVGINLKSAFYSKSHFFSITLHPSSINRAFLQGAFNPPSPHILPLAKKFAFSSGTEQRMVSEQRMKATSSDSVVVFVLLMLREFSGMIHWPTINNNPSNPQQPPATPIPYVKRTSKKKNAVLDGMFFYGMLMEYEQNMNGFHGMFSWNF